MPRSAKTLSAYLAVAGTSLLALAGLHLIADRFPDSHGINELRDYLVRPNG